MKAERMCDEWYTQNQKESESAVDLQPVIPPLDESTLNVKSEKGKKVKEMKSSEKDEHKERKCNE